MDTDKPKYIKKKIPKSVRNDVWDEHIGKKYGIGTCYVCGQEIRASHFECGHIIAESKGGKSTIDNLRPVCERCNKSVGTMNMDEFKNKYYAKPQKCCIIL